jgi:hypothetical protein
MKMLREKPGKIIKKVVENGAKWRFLESQSAISPCREPTALDRKPPAY